MLTGQDAEKRRKGKPYRLWRERQTASRHKKEGQILLYRKQHLFLRAHGELTAEQQQERDRIAARLPDLAGV